MNILVIGDAGVGKTNLTTRFVDDRFSEDTVPTIGADFLQKHIEIDN